MALPLPLGGIEDPETRFALERISQALDRIKTPTAAAVPANFAANYYIPIVDNDTNTVYFIPAMAASW